MVSIAPQPRVIEEPIEKTIRRLSTYVARMERRYECDSGFALAAVRGGHMKETAEVSRWLISYRTLQRLQAYCGHETGTPTTSTE